MNSRVGGVLGMASFEDGIEHVAGNGAGTGSSSDGARLQQLLGFGFPGNEDDAVVGRGDELPTVWTEVAQLLG